MFKIIDKIISVLYTFYISRKYISRMQVGKNILFTPGFKVYRGASYITVGSNVNLSDVLINASKEGTITIEDNVFFGHRCMVLARKHDYNSNDRKHDIVGQPILIKENAWIASGAIILSGVTIGKNSVIAAGAVVTKDVPYNTVSGGVPNRTISTLSVITPPM